MDEYSVLMTIYKGDNPSFVSKSIDSMLCQTAPTNDFVLVCDGPLTQELNALVDSYKKKYERLFNVYHLPQNVGLGAALQYGVLKCKNNIIARMDDDDISSPLRCETQLLAFEKHRDLKLIGSYMYEFERDINDSLIIKKVPLQLPDIINYSRRRNPFNHSSVMFKKDAIIEVGNYSNLRTNQDIDLWMRILNRNYLCMNIPKPLVYFRYDYNTLKRRKKWKNIKILIKLWRQFRKQKYCSFFDYLYVVFRQLLIFLTPLFVLKVYRKIKKPKKGAF